MLCFSPFDSWENWGINRFHKVMQLVRGEQAVCLQSLKTLLGPYTAPTYHRRPGPWPRGAHDAVGRRLENNSLLYTKYNAAWRQNTAKEGLGGEGWVIHQQLPNAGSEEEFKQNIDSLYKYGLNMKLCILTVKQASIVKGHVYTWDFC